MTQEMLDLSLVEADKHISESLERLLLIRERHPHTLERVRTSFEAIDESKSLLEQIRQREELDSNRLIP